MRLSLSGPSQGRGDKPAARKRIRLGEGIASEETNAPQQVSVLEQPLQKVIHLAPNKTFTTTNTDAAQESLEPLPDVDSEMLAAQMELLPPAPDEGDYENMPVEEFVAALARGLGNEGNTGPLEEIRPPAIRRRPARAGVGSFDEPSKSRT